MRRELDFEQQKLTMVLLLFFFFLIFFLSLIQITQLYFWMNHLQLMI